MGTFRSKEDDVQQISTSVFVTNFPDQFSAKDLWNTVSDTVILKYLVWIMGNDQVSIGGGKKNTLQSYCGYWYLVRNDFNKSSADFFVAGRLRMGRYRGCSLNIASVAYTRWDFMCLDPKSFSKLIYIQTILSWLRVVSEDVAGIVLSLTAELLSGPRKEVALGYYSFWFGNSAKEYLLSIFVDRASDNKKTVEGLRDHLMRMSH
ncbi:hypothetical protein Tco_1070920 [Tanacetum coccineum]|uniref:Uncharacterized protein n=1 Tax=Tanacetum coccineum TaxID=301880 RepID=A0ABQ5HMZ6_9ASTR